MREQFVILPHKALREPRLERRVIEYNRETFLFGLMFFGAILIFISLIW